MAACTTVEREPSAEVARRLTGADVDLRSRVLAATSLAALRVALQQWSDSPRGPLLDTIRSALASAAARPARAEPTSPGRATAPARGFDGHAGAGPVLLCPHLAGRNPG
ncbi:hypothetical protein ACI79C_08275 [Geodermatophilus sp. SYSU D00697]